MAASSQYTSEISKLPTRNLALFSLTRSHPPLLGSLVDPTLLDLLTDPPLLDLLADPPLLDLLAGPPLLGFLDVTPLIYLSARRIYP